jgi:alkyl sulfatase BDS1-like metallo-beta-lactamase superfamily hydrolase
MSVVQATSRGLVLRALPAGMARKFDPVAAGDLDATFEMCVDDERFAVRVAGGQCTVERRAAPEAGATVTISAGDIVRMVTGTVQWPVLLAAKRLELGGDPFLALRFPALFAFTSPR